MEVLYCVGGQTQLSWSRQTCSEVDGERLVWFGGAGVLRHIFLELQALGLAMC